MTPCSHWANDGISSSPGSNHSSPEVHARRRPRWMRPSMRWKVMSERHHGSIGGGGGWMWAQRRWRCGGRKPKRWQRRGYGGKDAGVRIKPRGLTLWFFRGDMCEETNRPPRSPRLPRPVTTSRHGACARNLWPCPRKTRRTFRLPEWAMSSHR